MIIGVEWNQGTDTWSRIDVDGNVIGAPDFDTESPWQDIVRCTLNTDGSENEVSANGKGDGISLDGSTGRVMVRIPKFWVKSDSPGANRYRWWISSAAHAGFVVHPAFYQRGNTETPADYIYVGAYEAGYDGISKLQSQTGRSVLVRETIGTFRTRAEAIGSGWGISSIWILSAIKLLYYIEYADADSQTTIGKGITDAVGKSVTGDDGINANLAPNGTGKGTGVDAETPIAYRGIENLWGNVKQFIDGYEAVNGSDAAHVKYRLIKRDGSGTFRNPLQAADYEESSDLDLPGGGYIKNIVWEDLLSLQFIGSDNTGLATSHLYDYFYVHDAGEVNILLASGAWHYGAMAGVAYLYSRDDATASAPDVGGRLEFILPPAVVGVTNAATGTTPTSAILNGTLEDDLEEVWEVRFQWGRTEEYGNETPWQAGFSTGDTFNQLINTLEPGTLYHFGAQAKTLAFGTLNGADVAFWTLKPSVGRGYAFSRKLHIKRATVAVDKASIDADAITTLADCRGINLVEVPSSLTLTVEATYDAAATQGIKVHVRTSLTDHALGTHSGADGAAALADAEAHFVADELIGLTIKNLTDGSSGVITANTGIGVTATLVGGTDNDWDSGDAYIIEGAGYDTEDWDSFAPAFAGDSSIRQTKHYDVDPVYLKVLVENLDPAKAVTSVKIIMAVGT